MGNAKKVVDISNSGNFMQKMAFMLQTFLEPTNLGFCLLVFPKGTKDGIANYVADCEREDMIKFLRETADRLEANKDNARG